MRIGFIRGWTPLRKAFRHGRPPGSGIPVFALFALALAGCGGGAAEDTESGGIAKFTLPKRVPRKAI